MLITHRHEVHVVQRRRRVSVIEHGVQHQRVIQAVRHTVQRVDDVLNRHHERYVQHILDVVLQRRHQHVCLLENGILLHPHIQQRIRVVIHVVYVEQR